jgi:hypothetical protein
MRSSVYRENRENRENLLDGGVGEGIHVPYYSITSRWAWNVHFQKMWSVRCRKAEIGSRRQ